MNRTDYVLAVLAAAEPEARFSPVQLQKLFFLLDRKIGPRVNGPHFNFVPYDYGPFDSSVYRVVEDLERVGMAVVERPSFGPREFMLTPAGRERGQKVLLDWLKNGPIADYIASMSKHVRSLSFQQLVASVYREYPDMKARSIFRE